MRRDLSGDKDANVTALENSRTSILRGGTAQARASNCVFLLLAGGANASAVDVCMVMGHLGSEIGLSRHFGVPMPM